MPTANLTDRKVASLKPDNSLTEWWDEKTPCFGIRVSPKGKKTWFVMYRFAGMRRRFRIGRYPEVTLEKARKKARNILSEVSEGKDPVQHKKAAEALKKRERLEAKTFAQLSEQYIEEYARLNKKSWSEDERIIKKLLKPEFGTLNVKEIERSHVRSYLRSMAVKTPVQANRTQALLRKIINWAIDEEIISLAGNPAAGITSPGGTEKPKERNLNDDEIKAVWRELAKDSTAPKRALQLLLLTGQRPGEVVGLPWVELNLKDALWMLPSSRAKNRNSNLVPLNSLAMRIIERQREAVEIQSNKRQKRGLSAITSDYVFPCGHVTKKTPMTVYALDQLTQNLYHKLDIPRFTPHDLRRTCSTKLGEMLYPTYLIKRITNHKPTGITDRVYNKYEYFKEKREALDAWGIQLLKIVSELELVKAETQTE